MYEEYLRDPALRDPRGYMLPADQSDFPTATKFVNALLKSGVEVHRATASFSANGKTYPEGSWVIKTAQAFRAHVLDMMEPQDYPNDIPYLGGPPRAPYDNAGYTLAMQMGVVYDRVLRASRGAVHQGHHGDASLGSGGSVGSDGSVGWTLSPQIQRRDHGREPVAQRRARRSAGSPRRRRPSPRGRS